MASVEHHLNEVSMVLGAQPKRITIVKEKIQFVSDNYSGKC